jgi:hypothetical protein
MNLSGSKIKLKGITQKGKNRVREHGNEWMVLAEADTILFAPGDFGPWAYIAPVGQGYMHKAARWVRVNNDVDFEVMVVSET